MWKSGLTCLSEHQGVSRCITIMSCWEKIVNNIKIVTTSDLGMEYILKIFQQCPFKMAAPPDYFTLEEKLTTPFTVLVLANHVRDQDTV